MRLVLMILFLVCFTIGVRAGAGSAATADSGPLPSWLRAKINELGHERQPVKVTKWLWHNQEVYFIPARCCDIPAVLFDVNGERICHLEGGFAGGYIEEKCRDFHDTAKLLGTVWENKPGAEKK